MIPNQECNNDVPQEKKKKLDKAKMDHNIQYTKHYGENNILDILCATNMGKTGLSQELQDVGMAQELHSQWGQHQAEETWHALRRVANF